MRKIFTILFLLTIFAICQAQNIVENFDNAVGNFFPDPPVAGENYWSNGPTGYFTLNDDPDHYEGTGSTKIDYRVEAYEDFGGYVARSTYNLSTATTIPYIDLSSGTHLSLWYKILSPVEISQAGTMYLAFKLAEYNELGQRELWFHRTAINLSDLNSNWLNITMPLKENLNEYAGFAPQYNDGDGILQLENIKGFEIEIEYYTEGGPSNSPTAIGSLLIDNLQLVGTKLSWTKQLGYELDGVNPDEGMTSSTFTFRVKYSDPEGDAPLSEYPKVHIKRAGVEITNSPFTMSEANTDPFTTGRIYTFDINTLESGSDYTYYFEAYDANSNQATGEATVEQSGPVVNFEQFTEQTLLSLPGVFGSSVVWGDYDNDGDLDILLAGFDNNNAMLPISKIYQNESGSFIEVYEGSIEGISEGSVAWADYDNDGDLDILLSGFDNNYNPLSKIYQNTGNGFVESFNGSIPGVDNGSAVWGDYDNDGDSDILLTGSGISKIFQNTGIGFTEVFTGSLTAVAQASSAWGDYDNDGDLDILLTGSSNSKIYENTGNGFSEVFIGSLTGIRAGSVTWGDYDNDGDLDILLAGFDQNAMIPISKIYQNNLTEFNEVFPGNLTGVVSGEVAWGDYDNDGDLDILITGYDDINAFTSVSKIYKNTGNGFDEVFIGDFPGVSLSSVGWSDFDNDGDLDFLLSGASVLGSITKIYLNNNLISNNLPSVSTNLSLLVTGNDALFNWDKSTDTETPQNGLKYNLVIGTSPNAVNTLSPMSDRATGYRRVVNMGNTNHNNSWVIKGLAPGTYYWSVQAIDNAFAGSAFAEEQSFIINGLQVTFNVNLSVLIEGGLFNHNTDAVYLRGSFNDWSVENPMTDQDNDGVYTLTLPLEQNSYYEYKFWINTPGAPSSGWEGKVGTGGVYGNRTLNTEISDIDIPTVYFSDLTTLPQIDDAVLCYSDQNYKGKPDVSPSGDQLTFYYSSLPNLYGDRHPVLCDIANDFTVNNITEMTNNTYGTFMDWEPVFRKPSGSEIYFITDRNTYWDLYKYDVSNMSEDFIFRWGAYYEIHNLRFSPDGDKFVCHSDIPSGHYLTIFNSDGSNPQFFENGYYPDWSSDGQNIVFVRNDSLFVLNLTSNQCHYVYSNGKTIYSPKWSPSGNKIVFTTMITNSHDIWTIDSEGNNAMQITTSIWDDLDPVWDGVNNRIYFVSSRSSQYSNIYSIPIESTPTTVDFALNLIVSDNCTNSIILQLGTAADATDGYDTQYDQYAPPSPPFSDIFDGRLRLNSEDYLKDFRATNSNGVVVWNVIYQTEGGCSPITLSWNPEELPAEGFFTLVDGFTGGSIASVDMGSNSSYTDNMGLGNLQIIFKYTKAMTNSIAAGWNILSLPIIAVDPHYQTLFPNATTGTLYGFNSAYYSTEIMETSIKGYWLRFPAAETVTLEGEPVDNTSISLNAGWNIIGSVFCDVVLSTVSDPGGIITPGTLYGFDGAYYSASSIIKGKAFWLRTSSAGTITLDCQIQTLPKANSQNLASMDETDLSDFSKIEIKDGNEITNTLYFSGKLAEGVDIESYSLPPIAPAGAFDVRLNGGYRLVESEEVAVNIQSSKYPVRITIDGNGKLSSTEGYIIKELSGGIEVASEMVKDKQELVINDSRVNMITIQKGQIVPAEYSLAQNYPNPFNPSTTIKLGLPEATRVKVSIYSMLGELITELLDTDMEAGYHRVEFNASGIASGVYLYRIETEKFNNVKKMLLIK